MKGAVSGNEDGGEAGRCEACNATSRSEEGARRPLRMYRPAMLLILIALVIAGLAYYRFFLPVGVAAVVNGESISVSDLDAALGRSRASLEERYGRDVFSGEEGAIELKKLRSRMLADMIRERVVLQEAQKAGVTAEAGEIDDAVRSLQAHWNLDKSGFAELVASRYNGMQAFRREVAEQLIIDRFMSTHVAGGVSDPAARQSAAEQWFRQAQGRAVVRVALAEQWSASGCACCAGRGGEAPASPKGSTDAPAAASGAAKPSDDRAVLTRKAEEAGLAYWRQRHGDCAARAEARDFGCHFEIDIIKGGRVVKSLRYQDDRVTEM